MLEYSHIPIDVTISLKKSKQFKTPMVSNQLKQSSESKTLQKRWQRLAVLSVFLFPSTAPCMLWRDVSHRVDVGSDVEALQVLTPRRGWQSFPISRWMCIYLK